MFMLYLLYVLFFHEMCSVISEDESLLVGQYNTKCYKPGLFFLKKRKEQVTININDARGSCI